MNNKSTEIKQLLAAQKGEWKLAGKNFAGLKNVVVREFDFDGFKIKVQFNPGRIVSSSAKVDKKSIEARQCFLCEANRPKEQRGVAFADYCVLVNPFPIFPEHFTVPSFKHTPQGIKGKFGDMLDLAKAMEGYTLFYNGPECGASAPDHFHFQAGNTGFMPIDEEIEILKKKYGRLLSGGEVEICAVKDGVRNFLVMESNGRELLLAKFESIYDLMDEIFSSAEEPMMNILTSCLHDTWKVLIFPRAMHRPWQYAARGEQNFLISPASVDMGGVLITPLEKDFEKIAQTDVESIFEQVLLSDKEFDELVDCIEK